MFYHKILNKAQAQT